MNSISSQLTTRMRTSILYTKKSIVLVLASSFNSRNWEQPEQCDMFRSYQVSSDTLAGEATHKILKSIVCSHWIDSRVISAKPTVRLWHMWWFQKLVRKLEVQEKPFCYCHYCYYTIKGRLSLFTIFYFFSRLCHAWIELCWWITHCFKLLILHLQI